MIFNLINNTQHQGAVPYLTPTCEEKITYSTSRFHSYQGISTWTSLQSSPLTHTVNASYALEQRDYLQLVKLFDRFSDQRYPLLVPEFYLAQRCTYQNNELIIDTPPWDISSFNRGMFFIGHYLIVFDISSTGIASEGTSYIRGNIESPVSGVGIFYPLKPAAVLGSSQSQTTTAISTTTVTYEYAVPRDYSQEGFTTSDLPTARGQIKRQISLPDYNFKEKRVRGRRGFVSRDSIGWGKRWGLSWGGRSAVSAQRKDNIYTVSYEENMDTRYDYRIKNIVSKALLDTTLIDLPDDNGEPFPAMLENDQLTIMYDRNTYKCDLTYSRRRLKDGS